MDFCGVRGIVSLINGDHFCLFQNTIFELNSGVLVRIFDNQRVTKEASRVLIRIKILHHFFLPKFGQKKMKPEKALLRGSTEPLHTAHPCFMHRRCAS